MIKTWLSQRPNEEETERFIKAESTVRLLRRFIEFQKSFQGETEETIHAFLKLSSEKKQTEQQAFQDWLKRRPVCIPLESGGYIIWQRRYEGGEVVSEYELSISDVYGDFIPEGLDEDETACFRTSEEAHQMLPEDNEDYLHSVRRWT